jgi:16S rRNA (guanine(966)-N(2))-methyltransferase RsmD
MRIIAGQWRGRPIAAPRGGEVTRPTSDRAREAIFSMLGHRVVDARVLDVFAGSGAMGLEALSRGAARAVLIDRDGEAQEAMRRNARVLGAGDRAECVLNDAQEFLSRAALAGDTYDLIFLDPPYAAGALRPALEIIAGGGLLERGGWVVAESAAGDPPGDVAGLRRVKEKRYGIAFITVYGWEDDAV